MEYLDYTKTTFDNKMGKDGAIIVTLEQGDKLTLILTQNAYVTGTSDNTYYTANAFNLLEVGEEDTEYRIEWKILDDYNPELSDESDACDWDNPSYIARY